MAHLKLDLEGPIEQAIAFQSNSKGKKSFGITSSIQKDGTVVTKFKVTGPNFEYTTLFVDKALEIYNSLL